MRSSMNGMRRLSQWFVGAGWMRGKIQRIQSTRCSLTGWSLGCIQLQESNAVHVLKKWNINFGWCPATFHPRSCLWVSKRSKLSWLRFLGGLGQRDQATGFETFFWWGKALQTDPEVVESLNRLSTGVAVPGKTPDAENRTIRCLTTDFLGDWKWHRVFGFEEFCKIFAFYLSLPPYTKYFIGSHSKNLSYLV